MEKETSDLRSSQNRDCAILEPKSIGEIMDRSLKLLPRVFGKLFVPYALLAILLVASTVSQRAEGSDPDLSRAMLVVFLEAAQGLIGLWLALVTMFVTADFWLGKDSGLSAVSSRMKFKLVLRFLGLGIRIGIVTILGLLLLILPGLIYALNRCLAPYILVVEGSTIKNAMSKSKYLMTRERWYSLRGPYMRVTAILIVVFIVGFLGVILNGGASSFVEKGSISWTVGALVLFASALIQYLAQVFNCLCYVGLFYDLRARYEGADLLSDIDRLERK